MNKTKNFFRKENNSSYGGRLLNTRKARSMRRPLATKTTMHLVMRSSFATGERSFNRSSNKTKINNILDKFCSKYGIKVISQAIVGNHLHFHIKLSNRYTYFPFIRAVTSSIAMAITGASRWRPLRHIIDGRFWDYRPFTRIVQGFKDYLNLKSYIEINQLEGCGYTRNQARYILAREWDLINTS